MGCFFQGIPFNGIALYAYYTSTLLCRVKFSKFHDIIDWSDPALYSFPPPTHMAWIYGKRKKSPLIKAVGASINWISVQDKYLCHKLCKTSHLRPPLPSHPLLQEFNTRNLNHIFYTIFQTFITRSYGDIKKILTPESVDEILWCDHWNETSSAILSHGTIYIFKLFYKMKFEIFCEVWF